MLGRPEVKHYRPRLVGPKSYTKSAMQGKTTRNVLGNIGNKPIISKKSDPVKKQDLARPKPTRIPRRNERYSIPLVKTDVVSLDLPSVTVRNVQSSLSTTSSSRNLSSVLTNDMSVQDDHSSLMTTEISHNLSSNSSGADSTSSDLYLSTTQNTSRDLPPNVNNIDAESDDSLFMYSEYAEDVCSHLRSRERAVRPDFVSRQSQVTPQMRNSLVNWLVKLHFKLKFHPETLYLSVNLIDRVLQASNLSRNRLQLLGISALLLASKYEEIYHISVENLTRLTKTSKQDILWMETKILKSLRFNLSRPLPIHFLRRFQQAALCDDQVTNALSRYILETSLLDVGMVSYLPSVLAAGSFCLANLVIKSVPGWTPELQFYSTYDLAQVIPVVDELTKCLLRIRMSSFKSVNDKYADISKLPQLEFYLQDFSV